MESTQATGHKTTLPTFCAIMPNYNDGATLAHAIGSLTAQTAQFDRILVVNDGSTDNSLEILAELQKSIPYLEVLDNEKNIGVVASANRGLEAVSEDYIFFVSANDYFEPRALELAKKAVGNRNDIALIAGQTRLVYSQTGKEIIVPTVLPKIAKNYDAVSYIAIIRARNFSFFGGSVFVHRTYCLSVGSFRAELKWHCDWLLFALLATRHGFTYIPDIVGNMVITPGQYSGNTSIWSKQSVVIADFIRVLRNDYPADYQLFKSIGLLPTYDFRALPMILGDSSLRDYLTPLLVWRLLIYKISRDIGRLMPRSLRERLRSLLRI